jgi:hypothetical protein
MTEQTLLNSDFEMLYSIFGRLPSLLVLGNGQESEIDLTFFANIKNLEVQHCKIVFVRGAENIVNVQLLDCHLVDLDMFSSLKNISVKNSPNISWMSTDKIVPIVEKINISNDFKAISSTPPTSPETPESPSAAPLIKLKSLASILSTNGGRYWDNLSELSVNYCGLTYVFETNLAVDSIGLKFCTNLQRLDVSHNKILHMMQSKAIQSPPSGNQPAEGEETEQNDESTIQFTQLTNLNLSFNRLQSIEKPSLNHFTNLVTLNLSHNFLRSTVGIADALGNSLENLDLSKNRIDNWEEVKRLRALKKLRSLVLTGNKGLNETLNYRALVCSCFSGHNDFILDGQAATKWELEYRTMKGPTDSGIMSQILAGMPINSKNKPIPHSDSSSYGTSSDDTTNLMEENLRGWHNLASATEETRLLTPESKETKKGKKSSAKKKKARGRIVDDIPEVAMFTPSMPTTPTTIQLKEEEFEEEVMDPVSVQEDYFRRMASNYRHESSSESSDDEKPKSKKEKKKPYKKFVVGSAENEDLIDKTRVESVQKHLEALKNEMGDQWLLILSSSEYIRDASDDEEEKQSRIEVLKEDLKKTSSSPKQIGRDKRRDNVKQEQKPSSFTSNPEEQRIKEIAQQRHRRMQEQRQKAMQQAEEEEETKLPGATPKSLDKNTTKIPSQMTLRVGSLDNKSPIYNKEEDRVPKLTRSRNVVVGNVLPPVEEKEPKVETQQEDEYEEQSLPVTVSSIPSPTSDRERKTSVVTKPNIDRRKQSITVVKPERTVRTIGKQPSAKQITRSPSIRKSPVSVKKEAPKSPTLEDEYYDDEPSYKQDTIEKIMEDAVQDTPTTPVSEENLLEELLRDDDDIELPKDVPVVKESTLKLTIDLDEILSKNDDDIDVNQEIYASSMDNRNILTAMVTPKTPMDTVFPQEVRALDYVVEKDCKSVRTGTIEQACTSVKISLASMYSPVSNGILITVEQCTNGGDHMIYLFELNELAKKIPTGTFPEITDIGGQPCVDGDRLARLFVEGILTDTITYHMEESHDSDLFISYALRAIETYHKINTVDFFGELLAEDVNAIVTQHENITVLERAKGTISDAMTKSLLKTTSGPQKPRRYSLKKGLEMNLADSVMPYYRDMIANNAMQKRFDCDQQRPNVKLIVNGETNWTLHCTMHVFDGEKPERLMHVIYTNCVVISNQQGVAAQEWSVAVVFSNRYFYLLQDCNYILEGLEQPAAARVLPMLVKQPLESLYRIHVSYQDQCARFDFDGGHSYLLISRTKAITKHIIQSYLDALITAEFFDCAKKLELVTYQVPFRQTLLEVVSTTPNVILSPEMQLSQPSLLTTSIQDDKIRGYGQVFWKRQEGFEYPNNTAIHSHAFPSTMYLAITLNPTTKKRRVIPGAPLTPLTLVLTDEHIFLCIETKLYEWPQPISTSSYKITTFAKRPISEITHVENPSGNRLEMVVVFEGGTALDEYNDESSSSSSDKKPMSDRWLLVLQDVSARDILTAKIGEAWTQVYHVEMDVTDGVNKINKAPLNGDTNNRPVTISGSRARSSARIAITSSSAPNAPAVASSVPTQKSVLSTSAAPESISDDYNENLVREIQSRRFSTRQTQRKTQTITSQERSHSLDNTELPVIDAPSTPPEQSQPVTPVKRPRGTVVIPSRKQK